MPQPKKFLLIFALISIGALSCVNKGGQRQISKSAHQSSEKKVIAEDSLGSVDVKVKAVISARKLELLTTSYGSEITDDSLTTFVQVIAEDSRRVVAITAPAEGGYDSWAIGEMTFIDSLDNSYRFEIWKGDPSDYDGDNYITHKLEFIFIENDSIELILNDCSNDYLKKYVSARSVE
jgi:hypothetical protein